MNKKKQIFIIGGGQTAAYAAKEIRSSDINSDITIISDEKYLPYEKPPLSKDFLLDKINFNNLLFFSEDFYKEKKINFVPNTKITKVDFDNKKISSKTKNFNYDKLLIATGSSNRHLRINNSPILPEDNIIYLRNSEESKMLKKKINLSKNIVIIGGGFIGLEIASSAAQKGKNITILEKSNQLMGRVIPKEIANIIQDKHQSVGTNIILDVEIEKIIKSENLFKINYNNKVLSADLIIIGVGSIPNTAIFENTSLKIDNGIITNQFSETSIEDVYAAGDVSNFYHPFYQEYMRLESYKHAQNHGINAGKNMVDQKTSYDNIPWMWSDQFNLNLQLTGICTDFDAIALRGSNIEEGMIYFFLKNRKIIGACGVGVGGKIGRDIRLAGKLSKNKNKVTKEIITNMNIKLNKI
jgi:3-phenylpropionate/trans-cinnamate dioxygenase ferredoxin reductase subunit